uniref:helix-turn-helix domain-containing protein n=1 Tax=Pedobacter schmidteae TaxID=2201271 RepID=UPI000EB3AE19|nr:helix-turn-helix domain-containing protein [Pedobacter schmidteae]
MNHIDRLLNDLNNMFPLSAGFWNDLPPMMTEKRKKSHSIFLKPGNIAAKAWQLLSGFILVIRIGQRGEEIVERIYYSKQIVTDMNSFFENTPVRFRFEAIGEVKVLEIKKSDVLKLERYPETQKLIQHIIFQDTNAADTKAMMLRLPPLDRIREFLTNHPVDGLPYQYCASLLNLSQEEYIENKVFLESAGFKPLKIVENEDELISTSDTAYKIKAYILKKLGQPDFGETKETADHFSITERTLNRLFVKTFGITVTKFILKRRMEKAYELLNREELTVGEAAAAAGYKDIYHFSRTFKRYYGYPPKETKKR